MEHEDLQKGDLERAARQLRDAVRRGDAPAVDRALERLQALHRSQPSRRRSS